MSELTINRRQAVRAAAGVAAGGLLVTGVGVGSAAADSSSGLLGSWLIHHEDDDGNKGLSVASLVDNGIIIANDIRPAGSVGTGSWEEKSGDRFKATFWSGNPSDDTSVRVEVWGKLKDKDTVTGTFEVTVYDSDGNEVFSVKGTFEGEPLEA
jgi:hypothetical protein